MQLPIHELKIKSATVNGGALDLPPSFTPRMREIAGMYTDRMIPVERDDEESANYGKDIFRIPRDKGKEEGHSLYSWTWDMADHAISIVKAKREGDMERPSSDEEWVSAMENDCPRDRMIRVHHHKDDDFGYWHGWKISPYMLDLGDTSTSEPEPELITIPEGVVFGFLSPAQQELLKKHYEDDGGVEALQASDEGGKPHWYHASAPCWNFGVVYRPLSEAGKLRADLDEKEGVLRGMLEALRDIVDNCRQTAEDILQQANDFDFDDPLTEACCLDEQIDCFEGHELRYRGRDCRDLQLEIIELKEKLEELEG